LIIAGWVAYSIGQHMNAFLVVWVAVMLALFGALPLIDTVNRRSRSRARAAS
jgi:hypothetical protein